MRLGKIMDSPSQSADRPLSHQAMRRNVHRFATADFQEVRRDKDRFEVIAAHGAEKLNYQTDGDMSP